MQSRHASKSDCLLAVLSLALLAMKGARLVWLSASVWICGIVWMTKIALSQTETAYILNKYLETFKDVYPFMRTLSECTNRLCMSLA